MTGFTPIRDASGKPYNGMANRYFVSGSDATALFIGDPVAVLETNVETAGHYRTVTKATLTANNAWVGVVVGFEPVSPELSTQVPNLENKHRPASTAMYAWVVDDPNVEYIIGEDGVGAVLVAGDIGNLGLAIAGAGGNTQYGRSSVILDSSTFPSGTANGQVILLGLWDSPANNLGTGTTSTALWRVKLNPVQNQLVTPPTSV